MAIGLRGIFTVLCFRAESVEKPAKRPNHHFLNTPQHNVTISRSVLERVQIFSRSFFFPFKFIIILRARAVRGAVIAFFTVRNTNTEIYRVQSSLKRNFEKFCAHDASRQTIRRRRVFVRIVGRFYLFSSKRL